MRHGEPRCAATCLIRRVLPQLARLRFKDLELDFGRRLAEARAEAATLPATQLPATQLPAPTATSDDALIRLADASPRAAILEAWLRLEAAALSAARRRGTTEPISQLRTPGRLIESREELGVIDARQAAVFHELRSLRNSAAHALGFEPSPEAARDYVRPAARLEQSLDGEAASA